MINAIITPLRLARRVVLLGLFFVLSSPAFAGTPSGGGDMPWDGPLDKILQDLQGNVAHVFILVAIIITGLMMAFGEHGSGFKKLMGIVFGASIVIGCVSLVTTLFGATF